MLARDLRSQLDVGTSQVESRRHAEQCVGDIDLRDHVGNRPSTEEYVVRRWRTDRMRHRERSARIALGIEIDDQYAQPMQGQRGGNVHGGRRLTDATLLIGDGDDVRLCRPRPLRPADVQHLDRSAGFASDGRIELGFT